MSWEISIEIKFEKHRVFHVGQFFGRVLDNMTQSIERQNY